MNSRENDQLKVTSQAEVADAARMAGDYQIIDNYLCIRCRRRWITTVPMKSVKMRTTISWNPRWAMWSLILKTPILWTAQESVFSLEDTSSFPASEERFLCFMRAGRSGVCSSLPGWTELWKSWNETFNQRWLPAFCSCFGITFCRCRQTAEWRRNEQRNEIGI